MVDRGGSGFRPDVDNLNCFRDNNSVGDTVCDRGRCLVDGVERCFRRQCLHYGDGDRAAGRVSRTGAGGGATGTPGTSGPT